MSVSAQVPSSAVTVRIAGATNTSLGNPVDIAFDGRNLYVAEKSNNALLRFDDILSHASGDVPWDFSLARTAPESVALVPVYLSSRAN